MSIATSPSRRSDARPSAVSSNIVASSTPRSNVGLQGVLALNALALPFPMSSTTTCRRSRGSACGGGYSRARSHAPAATFDYA